MKSKDSPQISLTFFIFEKRPVQQLADIFNVGKILS